MITVSPKKEPNEVRRKIRLQSSILWEEEGLLEEGGKKHANRGSPLQGFPFLLGGKFRLEVSHYISSSKGADRR